MSGASTYVFYRRACALANFAYRVSRARAYVFDGGSCALTYLANGVSSASTYILDGRSRAFADLADRMARARPTSSTAEPAPDVLHSVIEALTDQVSRARTNVFDRRSPRPHQYPLPRLSPSPTRSPAPAPYPPLHS